MSITEFRNYAATKVYGTFTTLSQGGYVMRILGAIVNENNVGEYIEILFLTIVIVAIICATIIKIVEISEDGKTKRVETLLKGSTQEKKTEIINKQLEKEIFKKGVLKKMASALKVLLKK